MNENILISQPITDIIKKRKSIRSYKKQPLTVKDKQLLEKYIQQLRGPFSAAVKFNIIDSQIAVQKDNVKLGTYGIIRGASAFIVSTIVKEESSLVELGYELESIILYATSLGLGTCWLGGTFKRGEFAKSINLKENEILPIISPVGYINDSSNVLGSIIRAVAGSNTRKPWKDIFFNESFDTELTEIEADKYNVPLEMVRLAPSASNKQPWRIVKSKGIFHFYLKHAEGYAKALEYDIQKVDMGIAMCHFELTSKELGLQGYWDKLSPAVNIPDKSLEYIISWIAE